MKNFLALAVLVGGMALVPAANAACTTPNVAALAGTYAYVTNGFSARSLSAGGFGNVIFDVYAASGQFTISTAGAVTVKDTVSINGQIYRAETYSGSVQYNGADCTGTLVLNSGVIRTAYDFAVAQGGAKLFMVDSDQGTAISGTAER